MNIWFIEKTQISDLWICMEIVGSAFFYGLKICESFPDYCIFLKNLFKNLYNFLNQLMLANQQVLL